MRGGSRFDGLTPGWAVAPGRANQAVAGVAGNGLGARADSLTRVGAAVTDGRR
jgi:hypothetical protein